MEVSGSRMIAGLLSSGDGVAIGAVVTMVTTLVIASRTRRDVKTINRAVNHVGPNEPTLIQRVTELHEDHAAFREWTSQGLVLIGRQVGVKLPDPPEPTASRDADAA
jgi:hypothetical protein